VAIVAKIDTKLPTLPGVAVWIEPDEPRHPLTGIVHALVMSEGRAVLACAADMPLVSAELVAAIACADPGPAPAVVASAGGELQPLLGCYHPRALELLAGAEAGIPLREAVAAIGPVTYEVTDPNALFNVNSPADLLQASAMLQPVDRPPSWPANRM
jgi:molybdopterin-guanine dinucleotide biosynthesis protein A